MCFGSVGALHAQDASQFSDSSEVATAAPVPSASNPADILRSAEESFRNGDYALVISTLESAAAAQQFGEASLRLKTSELLGVAYFFLAQTAEDENVPGIIAKAYEHFLRVLRQEQTRSLDALVFGDEASEFFESVRQEHEHEWNDPNADIPANRTNGPQSETIYIERTVSQRSMALNFFPFGIGQFQNDATAKGTLFAALQTAALAINIASYVQIESLRDSDGFYSTGSDGRSGEYVDALTWQSVQYIALSCLVGSYLWSIIDGIWYFESEGIEIRTLDGPPKELQDSTQGAGIPTPHTLGFAVPW
jgi:hypothetical protein